jgi:hypothetical protein
MHIWCHLLNEFDRMHIKSERIFFALVSSLYVHCRAFSTPPLCQASNASFSLRDLLACDQYLFPCIFIVSLLVISYVLIGLLLGAMLCPDILVVDVSIILAFRSRRTSVGLGFLALNFKE